MKETMGDRIRKGREAKGMTQLHLGLHCGLSAATIGKLEHDRLTASPRVQALQYIASALDLKLVCLLYGTRSWWDRLLNRWPVLGEAKPAKPAQLDLPEIAPEAENDGPVEVPGEEGEGPE